MKDKKIYVVMGRTGEHDDFRDWNVRAFFDKRKAEKLVKNCVAEYNRIKGMPGYRRFSTSTEDPRLKNKFDPDMDIDYNGTEYVIAEIPFEE